jgi:phosphate/sulfate permease
MKNISSFLVGTISTMGMAESIGIQPEIIDSAQSLPVDSLEAILSLIGGTISTIIIALLKRRWRRREEKRKKGLLPPRV